MFKVINNSGSLNSNSFKDYLQIMNSNLSNTEYILIEYLKPIDNITYITESIEIIKDNNYFEVINNNCCESEYLNNITDIKNIINENNFISIFLY